MPRIWANIKEKFNPTQPEIARDAGTRVSTTQTKLRTLSNAYELVEVVNRCINILVDNSAMIGFDVQSTLGFTAQSTGMRQKKLVTLLNNRPNPYMDISTFRRLVLMDFLVDGNAFIHFDGHAFYHIPAHKMEVVPDSTTFINSFVYNGTQEFAANEIIFIKDNSVTSVYRGDSRIGSSLSSLLTRESMQGFQKAFYEEGAVMGLIIETDELLSKKLKDRQEREWVSKYNPKRGGSGKPLILDNGMKAKSIANTNFREMDFTDSIDKLEDKVSMALGVPPILLNGGNNANIKPNLELMFYTTILPMLRKFEAAFEFFFAYDIELTTHRVPALKPDLKDQAERLSALVNNGIMTGAEAREELRLDELTDPLLDKIRVPANVAGSATGVTGQEGGKPTSDGDDK